jgi:hypothetical protein
MKVTIKKLLSLIVIPAALIYSNFVLCSSIDMSLLIIVSTVIIDLALLFACIFIFNQHKDYKFKIGFEFVPLCCIGIGVERGSIGLILPFFVIAFGWTEDVKQIWDVDDTLPSEPII